MAAKKPIKREVGQVWEFKGTRGGQHSYVYSGLIKGNHYIIKDLGPGSSAYWGYHGGRVVLVPVSSNFNGETQEKTLDRKSFRRGIFEFVGVSGQEARHWSVFCTTCGAGDVVHEQFRPGNWQCEFCS